MKPVSYLQTDKRWNRVSYAVKGEGSTIGSAGCGVVCMAMVIASLSNPKITPVDTAKWSLSHGYKAYKQGTYYSYFSSQGKEYGIKVTQMNNSNLYKSKSTASENVRVSAINEIKKGNWIIACMGKGNWTSSGHFVLCYAVEGNVIYINDPASTKPGRTKGNLQTWKNEVKYLWKVEVNKESDKKKTEVDTEMVDKAKMLVNGKEIEIERILKDGTNYVKLRDFDDKMGLLKVGYDADKNMAIINSK